MNSEEMSSKQLRIASRFTATVHSKNNMKKIIFILLFMIRLADAKPSSHNFEPDIQQAVFSITLVMVHDVVDPPLA